MTIIVPAKKPTLVAGDSSLTIWYQPRMKRKSSKKVKIPHSPWLRIAQIQADLHEIKDHLQKYKWDQLPTEEQWEEHLGYLNVVVKDALRTHSESFKEADREFKRLMDLSEDFSQMSEAMSEISGLVDKVIRPYS